MDTNIGQLLGMILETRDKVNELSRNVDERLRYQIGEISRLENNVESAVTTLIHELIEYLRCNDIQSLDEVEFAARLRELLRKEPELPF